MQKKRNLTVSDSQISLYKYTVALLFHQAEWQVVYVYSEIAMAGVSDAQPL